MKLVYLDLSVCLKVAISEFGLSMLTLIFLNHYMLNKVMRYLQDNKWFGKPIKCLSRPL